MSAACECGCGGATSGRRFIQGHNNRLRRLEPRVEARGYATPCWIWPGWLNDRGYGRGAGGPAHKVAWERIHGPVAAGLELDHLCRVRACVNPEHLEAVTHQENMRRGYAVRAVADTTALGAAIRSARLTAGLSQSQLAALIGSSQPAVALWERGKVKPSRNFASMLNVVFVATANARPCADYIGRAA